MLIDARTLPADEIIETEICIVGAGPAGITIAREFLGQDFRVCLLESGGLEANEDTQSLCEGETMGDPFRELTRTRCRQFGGTANFWNVPIRENQVGCKYLPLDEIDFQKRYCVPYSGWPFSKSHLDPFYERAQSICQLRPFAYDAGAWEEAQNSSLKFKDNRIGTSMIQFGPSATFIREYRSEIERAKNITTYLNANVVDIETDESATTVTRLRVACLQGKEFWVSAKVFILATGGIENARLLLLSNKIQKTGLGNQNDLVGRFFMEHPIFLCGQFIPANQQIFNSAALYDLRQVKDVPVLGKLTFAQEVMQREQLLNTYAMLHGKPKGYKQKLKILNSLKILLSSVRQGKLPHNASKHLTTTILGIDELIAAVYRRIGQGNSFPDLQVWGWSNLPNKEQRFACFEVMVKAEQTPHPDNRVMLGAERDRLGQRKAGLHWQWQKADIINIRRSQALLAKEIARSGLGKLELEPIGEGSPRICGKSDHHMGTTRMHTDPKQGVVDENCRVHNVSNLFVAGSSVFPTGGCANPTLTIVALAVRLSDHLKEVMAQEVEVLPSYSKAS